MIFRPLAQELLYQMDCADTVGTLYQYSCRCAWGQHLLTAYFPQYPDHLKQQQHLFNGHLSGITMVSRYQNGKTSNQYRTH